MSPALLLLLPFALKFGRAANTASKLQISLKNLFWSKTDKKMYLLFDVFNPTNGSIKIDSIMISVFANEKKIGTVERAEPLTISKTGHTELKVAIKLSPFGLALFVIDAAINKGKKFEFKALGTVRAMGLNVPVNKTYEFSI